MNSPNLDLAGRVALVTGAGQNVGRQIALHLAAHGAGGVVVNDYFADRAEKVAAEIGANGGKAIGVQADITKRDAIKQMVDRARGEFGRDIEILVNNAGNAGAEPTANARKPFWETDTADWNSYLGVNLYGVVNCAAAVIPGMIAQRHGKIVTIISDAGRMGEAGLEIYSAAKAGAAGLTRALARSLGRHNIRANNIAIAAMSTPGISARLAANPERAKQILERYVVRRFGEPTDVANMALFLASDASDWITGQTYPVNGGFSFTL
jgi:2-hydroxycyclohexanecarboxyl-CoA dehydrogenase